MQINRRHITEVEVTAGSDTVFCFTALAPKNTVTGHWLDYLVVGLEDLLFTEACSYSVRGYLFELDDPDTEVANPNTVWDRLVPKDSDFGSTLDYDTGAGDSDPFEQPGMINIEELFAGYLPELVFDRTEILHAMSPGSVVTGSTTWKPMSRIRSHMKRNLRVQNPSVLMYAISSPVWGTGYDTYDAGANDRQQWVPENIVDWTVLTEPEDFVKDWMRQAMGITTSINQETIKQLYRSVEQIHVMDDGAFEDTSFRIIGKHTSQVTTGGLGIPVLHS